MAQFCTQFFFKMSIELNPQDRNLADLVERAATEQRKRGSANMAAEGSAVLHSCGDLFMFYKKCMVQCTQLSSGTHSMGKNFGFQI